MPSENITFILGRLEGKVDSLLVITKQQSTALAEHDQRIRKLELYRSYVIGIAVAVAAISSLFTHFLGAN
tara:strand:- start:59 stop:268 length:210 start_codon:yes stop_codon:yes gene_type:complete